MTQTPATYWKGHNGIAYAERQSLSIESRARMFRRIFGAIKTNAPRDIIEFGASVGDNLRAIRQLTGARLTGVEINRDVCFSHLVHSADEALCGSLQTFETARQWDMAFTRGVLIHVPPKDIEAAYNTLYNAARRYILVAEYYSPKPVEIEYRGQTGLLWKRDFAGDLLERFTDLRLVDYGFVYRRDPQWPQDDINWFLMEKV